MSLPLLYSHDDPTYNDGVLYFEDDELTPVEIAQQADTPVSPVPDVPEAILPPPAPYSDNNQPVGFDDFRPSEDPWLNDTAGSSDCEDPWLDYYDIFGSEYCGSTDGGIRGFAIDFIEFFGPFSFLPIGLVLVVIVGIVLAIADFTPLIARAVGKPIRLYRERAANKRRVSAALDLARTAYAVLNEVRWIGENVRSLADRLKSRRKAQNLILGWDAVEHEVGTIDRTMAVLLEAGVPRRLTMVTIINFEKECQAVTDAVNNVASAVDDIGRQCIGLDDVVRSFVSNPEAYTTLASKYVLHPDTVPVPLPSMRLFGVVSIPRKVLSIGRR